MEEAHLLTWFGEGILLSDVWDMTSEERMWWLKRIEKQIKADNRAQKDAMRGR